MKAVPFHVVVLIGLAATSVKAVPFHVVVGGFWHFLAATSVKSMALYLTGVCFFDRTAGLLVVHDVPPKVTEVILDRASMAPLCKCHRRLPDTMTDNLDTIVHYDVSAASLSTQFVRAEHHDVPSRGGQEPLGSEPLNHLVDARAACSRKTRDLILAQGDDRAGNTLSIDFAELGQPAAHSSVDVDIQRLDQPTTQLVDTLCEQCQHQPLDTRIVATQSREGRSGQRQGLSGFPGNDGRCTPMGLAKHRELAKRVSGRQHGQSQRLAGVQAHLDAQTSILDQMEAITRILFMEHHFVAGVPPQTGRFQHPVSIRLGKGRKQSPLHVPQ